MKKIVWTFHRFNFTLCNWILSTSKTVCLCHLHVLPSLHYNMLEVMLRNVLLCHDPEVLSQSFFILSLSGMRPHLSPVTIYTLFHHKVLRVTQTHTLPRPISCLIQTCLMSPLTDPHRLSSTHAHRHSITGKQRRPHINPSSKASTRPFPMRMRCPKALWCYLASAKARMWSMPPQLLQGEVL